MPVIKFDSLATILNPFVLLLLTVISGLLVGKIKIGKFRLGSSGTLFVGLVMGWIVYGVAEHIYAAREGNDVRLKAALEIFESNGGKLINNYFFTIALIFFVASVGLLASKDLGVVVKKYGSRFVILAIIITFVGAAATYTCSTLCKNTNSYATIGVYTGALTSSPGLASALETANEHAIELADDYETCSEKEKQAIINLIKLDEKYDSLTVENTKRLTSDMKQTYVNQATSQVGIGSAVGYPFGVIIVILAVNFLNVIFKFDVEEERRKYIADMKAAHEKAKTREIPVTSFNIISFAIVCLVGYILGTIKVYLGPLGYVSLEATGGVLISALLLGYIGRIGPISFRMDSRVLIIIRELAISFFLAVVGLNYGHGVIEAIIGSGVVLAIMSLIVGTIAVLVGFFVGRYILNLNWILLSGAICGGMTSTPGLGAATEAVGSDDPGVGYGATYPFALLGMVLFSILLNRITMI